jgi:hypothetical protein
MATKSFSARYTFPEQNFLSSFFACEIGKHSDLVLSRLKILLPKNLVANRCFFCTICNQI